MTAPRKLAIVPDALVLIHEFESAVLARRDRGRRDRALDALLVAMGEPPLYGERV